MLQKTKRIIKNITMPVAASILLSSAAYADELLRSATVLEFKDDSVMTEKSSGLQTHLPFLVGKRLENNFRLVNNPEVDRLLSENPAVDRENLDKISKAVPDLDYIISGSYSIINNRDLSVSTFIVDLKTGKIATQYFEGKLENLFNAADAISDEIKSDLGYQVSAQKQEKEEYVHTKEHEDAKAGLLARKGKWSLSPLVRFTFPLAPEGFKEIYNPSFNVGVEIMKVGSKKVGFGFPIINYNVHQADSDKVIGAIGADSFDLLELGSLSFLDVNGMVRFYPVLDSDTIPFLSLSGGYSYGKERESSVTVGRRKSIISSESSDHGGNISAGLGLEQLVGKNISFKGSVTYKHLFLGDGFDTFSLDFGMGFYFGGKK